MDLKKIVAVSGRPGLYEIKAQSKAGIIVESLLDGKRFPITVTHNVSVLNDIAIYTYEEEVPLREIFKTIFEKEQGAATITHKASSKELTTYFSEILPSYDAERVYASNIKKVIQWYNLLAEKSFDFTAIPEEEEESEETAKA